MRGIDSPDNGRRRLYHRRRGWRQAESARLW